MKWFSSLKDKLPEHQQMVLVSFEGTYYVAIFDLLEKAFCLTEEPEQAIVIDSTPIYWTEFTEPN